MRHAWLMAFGLFAARPALACGMCVDQEIRVWLPFAGPVMALCLASAASHHGDTEHTEDGELRGDGKTRAAVVLGLLGVLGGE